MDGIAMLDSVHGGLTPEGYTMLLQWLTFAIMILIQAIAAAVIITKVRTNVEAHTDTLKDHEGRIREVEKFVFGFPKTSVKGQG